MTSNNGSRTRLGVEAENQGSPALDPGIVAMAVAAESAGVDSISVSDHLVSFAPTNGLSRSIEDETWLEAFACLSAISSVTSRAKLIASVIVLPQRNLLALLKSTSTINFLSKGRLVLGVGAGGNRSVMEALGYDFTTRGRRMDEMLEVMRGSDGVRVPQFQGRYVDVPEGVILAPNRPVPIYIGGSGTSRPSLLRAIRYGDGWMPYSPTDRYDPATLRAAMAVVRTERALLGKPMLDTTFKLHARGHADPDMERIATELAGLGFDEIVMQGIWDAGIEKGIDAIARVRQALDSV